MNNSNGDKYPRTGDITTIIQPSLRRTSGGGSKQWEGEQSTYYNLPLVKKAHWGWEIVVYFFLGGIAAGSYLVSTLADFFGTDKNLVRAGRYLSFVCIIASPILLIMDLGRPERFHHMLRIFKLRSAMSLGTWGLTFFGLLCGFTTAHQMAKDGLLNWFPLMARLMKALPVKVIEAFGVFFGLFVGSYTGVLLSSTAVPVWGRAKHLLGPLFLTSGISTGLSALSFILSFRRYKNQKDTLERLDTAEIIAQATELGLIAALVPTLGKLSKRLFTGKTGLLFNIGTIGGGLILPLSLKLGWKGSKRTAPSSVMMASSLLVLVGGLILRTAWILAGRSSADDPGDTHYYNNIEWNERKG